MRIYNKSALFSHSRMRVCYTLSRIRYTAFMQFEAAPAGDNDNTRAATGQTAVSRGSSPRCLSALQRSRFGVQAYSVLR